MTAKTNRKEGQSLVRESDGILVNENPVQSKVLMIPKFRFDEVNEKYKKYKKDVVLLMDKLDEKDKENSKLLNDIKSIKKAYDNALLNLKVKETFL